MGAVMGTLNVKAECDLCEWGFALTEQYGRGFGRTMRTENLEAEAEERLREHVREAHGDGTCTREGCDLPTVNDDACWWCRNDDAGTCLATL